MYQGKIFKAVQFASHKHKDQKRKAFDYPYITHPLMVFHVISEYSQDEDVLVAALLHDTVEDTDTNLDEIKDQFGDLVAEYVRLLSEDKSLPYTERKEQYRKQFIGAPKEVLLIKTADLFCNLHDTLEMIRTSPENLLAQKFTSVSWVEQTDFIIKTILAQWEDNPLKEKLLEVFDAFENIASKTKTSF